MPSGAYYMSFMFHTKLNNTDHRILNMKLYADVKTIR